MMESPGLRVASRGDAASDLGPEFAELERSGPYQRMASAQLEFEAFAHDLLAAGDAPNSL